MSAPTIAVVTVYLCNGLSFRFTPTDPDFKPPADHTIEEMLRDEKRIQALENSTPHVILRWGEVVAVQVAEERRYEAGPYA